MVYLKMCQILIMFSANVVVRLLIKGNLTTALDFNAGVKESIDLKQYM